MTSLNEIIHETALRNNPKAIAEELNKPYSTFMREINPYDEGGKLGVDALIPFTRATDFSALDFIEQSLGRVAFPLPKAKPSPEKMRRRLAKSIQEFGELIKTVGDSIEDGTITDIERAACEKEAYELIQAIVSLINLLKGR